MGFWQWLWTALWFGGLAVFDISGRRLATLAQGVLPAGERSIRWNYRSDDGRTLPTGLYLVRADVGGGAVARVARRRADPAATRDRVVPRDGGAP